MGAPFFIVFAGVNGAGKTTFFHSGLWKTADMPSRMARVNPDEIARTLKGGQSKTREEFEAGRVARQRIEQCFDRHRSFNQETTLSGHAALKNLVRAHDLGYRTFMYYIGVDSAQTATQRVAHRAALGGHDIDEQVITRRYRTSLSTLAQALDYCEQVMVFDNTIDFTCLALWSHGTLAWWGGNTSANNWLVDAMTDDEIWQRS